MLKTQIFIALTVLIWLTMCEPTLDHLSTVTNVVCQPSQTLLSKNGFPEIHEMMRPDGDVWALLFFDKAYAKTDVKIVWRISATGKKFDILGQHTDGTIIHPIWGPEYHTNSNWDRPGDEWGTGFNFPEPGCWTITVTLGETIGEIRLGVLAP